MSGQEPSDELLGSCRAGFVITPAKAAWPYGRLRVYADKLVIDGGGAKIVATITGRPQRVVIPADQISNLRTSGLLNWTMHVTDYVHGTIEVQGPGVASLVGKLAERHNLTIE